jgi:hypothetical protein
LEIGSIWIACRWPVPLMGAFTLPSAPGIVHGHEPAGGKGRGESAHDIQALPGGAKGTIELNPSGPGPHAPSGSKSRLPSK